MYAIIEDSGGQIMVREGDVIRVATREVAADAASITFDKVLMVGQIEGKEGADAMKIGAPLVAGATVVGDLLAEERSDKVIVMKYRRRKNYRRKKGHRQDYLKVKVTAIQL